MDEFPDSMFNEGRKQVIVVGIDNGQKKRMREYNPWDFQNFGKGEGDLYAGSPKNGTGCQKTIVRPGEHPIMHLKPQCLRGILITIFSYCPEIGVPNTKLLVH